VSGGRASAEAALRRVEELVVTLDGLPQSHAREVARQLMEAVLDLHGLALARMVTIAAMSGHGETLSEAFAADERVAAVLLLHGLHPEMPQTRVRRALDALRPQLRAQGADVAVVEVKDGVARLRLRIPGASREEAAMLRREVEAAVVEAAPDLDEVAILNEVASVPVVAAAS
jgi:Fe-S cluster biogenesis protein NfuA